MRSPSLPALLAGVALLALAGAAGADTPISALPSVTLPLAGTEFVPMVQSGATKKATPQAIANLAPVRSVAGRTGAITLTPADLGTQTANTVLGALTATAPSGLAMPSCSTGSSALIWTSGTGFGCHTVSGLPGGTSGQVQINSAGAFGGITISGDGTLNTGTGALTVTKTNGSAFASSATTDTTNAANISSGTLPAARLPNPAASTLGGVKSLGVVTHQFLTGISTLGVPTQAQPAAADVSGLASSATTDTTNAANISSGTLPAARLPNPSATTLGGVESIAAVTHQFVTSISTSGVPAQAQPAAGDISGLAASATTDTTNASNIGTGSLALARIASLSANTVLGALTATTPSGLAMPSCSTGSSALIWTSGTGFGCNTISGSGTPGGTTGQVQYNNSGAFGGFTVGGDATLNTATGALTVTKTSGSAFAASATTDATNASNISSGTLPAARLPNPSATTLGGVESIAAVTHQFVTSISTSGVPAQAQPAAGDISGLATSATTDTTNASNIASGSLALARIASLSANSVMGALTATTPSGLAMPSCSTGSSALTWTSGTGFGCNTISGSGSPGGTSGQVQYNNSGAFAGFTVSGDATLNTATGALTVTKTSGSAFAASATTDATNASNIASGSLALARIASLSANTVMGALTATTPSGLAMPSCGTGSSALTWTSGTGFGCNTISGSGTVNSGTSGQMAYYASTAAAVSGNANATISAGGLTLGVSGTTIGTVALAGNSTGTITIKPQAAAGTYNFNLPTTAGTAGQPMLSAAGGTSPMTWGALSGNTTTFGTTSGTLISGNCVQSDANHNLVDAGAACGGGGGGTPGGSNTQVQFNNSGAFGGSAKLTWNGSRITLNNNAAAAASPTTGTAFQVEGADGVSPKIELYAVGAASPLFSSYATGGTGASPTAVTSGLDVMLVSGGGYDGTGYSLSTNYDCLTTETWTAAHHGTSCGFGITATGTTTFASSLGIENDGGLTLPWGSATGLLTSKGAGSLNVTKGFYINGAPLLPRSYLAGLTLSNDSGTPNSVLDIAAGQATDSTNAATITLGAITKSTAGAWASGSGANGMGNGLTVANSTWYHVCLTTVTSGGAADVFFDTSASCANAPTGTTYVRRIGSFKTDASAHILAFTQVEDTFYWGAQTLDVNVSNQGTTAVLYTLNIPLGVKGQPLVRAFGGAGSGGEILLTSPDETDVAPGSAPTSAPAWDLGGGVGSTTNPFSGRLYTNASSQIRARAGLASQTLAVTTRGWVDSRGRLN